MSKVIAAIATISIAALGIASPASAFVGGGRQPSEAPLVAPGVHYFGTLNDHANDTNEKDFGGFEVAFWKLPQLETRDQIVVSWHEATFANSNDFPIRMAVPQNANNANWGAQFRESYYGDAPSYEVSGSGSSETSITAQEPTSNAYLEFYARASASSPSDLEDYPYDFTVSSPLHYLSAAISPTEHVRVNGTISASVTKADGSPAPDGLIFTLNVSKDGEGIASYTATTGGGGLTFRLALPETLVKENAEFIVSRAADGTYQGVESAKLDAQLARPQAVPPSPCPKARARAHALVRQLSRLKRRVRFTRGKARRRIHRRAHRVAHRLRSARRQAAAVCGAN